MTERKKISLTAKELFEVRFPRKGCFFRYNEHPCRRECSERVFRLCRKVTLLYRRHR